jgi:hypothetical protein
MREDELPARPMPRSEEDRLDLSGMRIGELRTAQLAGLRGLRTLVLRHNSLRALPPLEIVPHLESLDLSHNELGELGADVLRGCVQLRWLDCAHNRLGSIPALSSCCQLDALRLDANRIRSLEPLPHALPLSLTQLSMRENGLESLQQLRFLASLSQLSALELSANPLIAHADERGVSVAPFCAFLLPSLRALDRRLINERERALALGLFADVRGAGATASVHGSLDPNLLSLLRPPCTDGQLWAHLVSHLAAHARARTGAAAAGAATAEVAAVGAAAAAGPARASFDAPLGSAVGAGGRAWPGQEPLAAGAGAAGAAGAGAALAGECYRSAAEQGSCIATRQMQADRAARPLSPGTHDPAPLAPPQVHCASASPEGKGAEGMAACCSRAAAAMGAAAMIGASHAPDGASAACPDPWQQQQQQHQHQQDQHQQHQQYQHQQQYHQQQQYQQHQQAPEVAQLRAEVRARRR